VPICYQVTGRREFASGCRDLGQLDAFPQQTLYSVGIATIAFGVTPRHARRLHRSRLQQDPARRRSARRESGIQAEVARTEERLDGLFFDVAGLGTVGIYGGLVPPWAPESGASATGARFRSTGAKRHGDRMGALSRPGIGVVRGNDAANRTRRAAGATDRAGFFFDRAFEEIYKRDEPTVGVKITDDVTLSGVAADGTASGITAAALPGSSGQAGQVVLTAGGMIALSGGAEVSSSTAGLGNGGSVQVMAQGPLSLTDPGSGIVALAMPTASGNAGSVTVTAPQITLTTGAEIASTTAGSGAGGSVTVTTPGVLVLNGTGFPNTQIAASATGLPSGPGGSVTVAANALTVEGGAQIASSTAGPGRGGDVNITVASDVVLPDPKPQITARSTGSNDAGSITLSAARLLMNDGASISTEAETSTANGGNITLHLRDFLYLVSSEITTSVKGETGNGGNIAIDPQLVILNHSSIITQAVEGHGGNIAITAGQYVASSDSIVSATSQLGISGTVEILGPRVDVNGALVVLSSELRGRAAVLREACAARGDRPVSSLVETGRGGLPQDPEATLPALYIAGRDLNPNSPAAAGTAEASSARQTTLHLTMRCG
jgi:hypothetical protein